MPALHPGLLQTAFYVYPSRDDAESSTEFGGSGFFFCVPCEGIGNLGFLYAVTCSHVLYDTKPNPVIRINTSDGKYAIIETRYEDWTRHPKGDDVAILNLGLGENHKYSFGFFGRANLITDELVNEKGVFVGDEIIMIGRFRVHTGKKKNLPVAMFGYISMMPEEPIYNNKTKLMQESYLVEMRSISGFSGSPVLLWIPPLSPRPYSNFVDPNSHTRLLGVCWGYINVAERARDISDQEYELKLNSSMAAVVPFQKVMDLIDSNEEIVSRQKENKALKLGARDSEISAS
jgi:hypothetical protein